LCGGANGFVFVFFVFCVAWLVGVFFFFFEGGGRGGSDITSKGFNSLGNWI